MTEPLGDERVRFGAGHSYIRKRFKQRARKGTVDLWTVTSMSDLETRFFLDVIKHFFMHGL